MIQTGLHYFLHFGLPVLIALVFFNTQWQKVSLILLSTMLVDADHLLATPMFDPNRCSINFHILHQYWVFPLYVGLLFSSKPIYRFIGLGLSLHMVTDFIDCQMMTSICTTC